MRNGLLIAALLAADTLWLYALWTMLSRLIGQASTVFPLWVIGGVITVGFFATRAVREASNSLSTTAQVVLGGATMFIAVACMPWPQVLGFGARVVWPITWATGALSSASIASLILVCLGCALAWRRGVRHAFEPPDQSRIMFVFKLGLAVVCVATLAELGCQCDLRALPTSAAFLAIALGALALERLAPSTELSSDWARTIARALTIVAATTAALGFIGANFGTTALSVVGELWRVVVTALIQLLTFVLTPVLALLFSLVEWLKSRGSGRGDGSAGTIDPPAPFEWSKLAPVQTWGDSLLTLIELGLVAVFFLLLARVLFQRRRRRMAPRWGDSLIEREALAAPSSTRWQFLRGLWNEWLPDWLTGHETPTSVDSRGPAGSGPVALYFETLSLARSRGHVFDRTKTPNERVAPLVASLPTAPVNAITDAFNQARYGHGGPSKDESELLKAQLHAHRDPPRVES